jgi:hypothetical protein
VPSFAVSGVYEARFVSDTGHRDAVPFVVRDDASRAAVVYQTSDTTWEAYNDWGGHDLYGAQAVSYDRPWSTGTNPEAQSSWFFASELPLVRFLERNGYDVTYQSGADTDAHPERLGQHRVFVSSGHDEYWSRSQRDGVERARDRGTNLAFFGGNVAFWEMRWEDAARRPTAPGADSADHRVVVCYREGLAGYPVDPAPEWTGMWRDGRTVGPPGAGRPENALTGQLWGRVDSGALHVSAAQGALRIWRATDLARLGPGAARTFGPGLLGYEFDYDAVNRARPAGLVLASDDSGSTPGAHHHISEYRAPSGALVFGAGTIQWNWGLDDLHQRSGTGATAKPDRRIQQATLNVLADMHAIASTPMRGLQPATPSTDTTAPTLAIDSLHASVVGEQIRVAGTARDVGGVVAGVEVSFDDGTTWEPAAGTTTWSAARTATTSGPWHVLARAVDDSANTSTAATGEIVVAPRTCPCTLLGNQTPANLDGAGSGPIEVGMRFSTDRRGTINAIRYYAGPHDLDVRIGRLWSSNGRVLATAHFAPPRAAGWQVAPLDTPVAVQAGTEYVVSYYAPHGHVAADAYAFGDWFLDDGRSVDMAPLHARRSGGPADPNGVTHDGGPGFPSVGPELINVDAYNYWVDVVFTG